MNKITVFAILIFFIGMVVGTFWTQPLRMLLSYYNQKEYSASMFKCDQAMRENFIAKARVLRVPSKKSADELHATEIALIDCHEYDKLRKRLGSMGLTQDDLGIMGLNAIEAKGADIRSLVRYHEIRY